MLSRLWRDEGATHILYPMMALVALTFAVLLLIPYRRFKAGREGRVTAEVSLPNRNLINLLEMPVLFYAASNAVLVVIWVRLFLSLPRG